MSSSSPAVIERRSGLSLSGFIAGYDRHLRPVLLTDACRDWPARGRWTPEYLVERHGAHPVTVDGRATTIADVVAAAAVSTPEAPAPYLRECKLAHHLPALLADIEPMPLYGAGRLDCRWLPRAGYINGGNPELFIGGRGAGFPVLHYDLWHMHAFLTQLHGEKRFWLYPPDETPRLYPKPDRPNESRIEHFDPVDTARFPDYAATRPLEFVLAPGETLFIPSGWWHRTRMLSLSISVAINAASASNWAAFSADYIASPDAPGRQALKYWMMRGIGAGLRIGESLRRG